MSLYFSHREIACPCGCGFIIEDPEFLNRLDAMREFYGDSIFTTERGGICRCKKYNKEVGGVEDSEHREGKGGDLKCMTSRERFLMIQAAIEAGFTRIGIGKTFIHVGCSQKKDPEVIWLYEKE